MGKLKNILIKRMGKLKLNLLKVMILNNQKLMINFLKNFTNLNNEDKEENKYNYFNNNEKEIKLDKKFYNEKRKKLIKKIIKVLIKII
jgi:hypothetical protein